jgi:hypothetical protein
LLRIKFYLFLSLLVFLATSVGKTQDTITHVHKDTISQIIKDTIPPEIQDTFVKVHHSPTRAAILSAVMPGMGQIYNKKAWKVPFIYGGLGVLGYYIVKFNNLYLQYQNAYVQYYKFTNVEILKTLPRFSFENDIKRQLVWYKDTYRRWRDMDVLLFGAVYILNIIDATVDAYLFNYDISQDLSLRLEPTLINTYSFKGTPGLKLSLKLW